MEKRKDCTYSDVQGVMLPIFDALDALRGRWRLPILVSLIFADKRFTEISREVTGISDKVLAKELKALEINSLIKRVVYNTFPPTSEYSATEHGKSVEKLVIELKN